MANDYGSSKGPQGTRQDLISGKTKVHTASHTNIFLGSHPSDSEAKEQKPPKARLKPTFKGSVPGPGSINKKQP